MNHNLEIQKVLLEADKLSAPDDRIAMLKQAIKIADASQDIDWGYDLRMQLIQTEQYTNHSRESVPAFAWILDVYDNNPDIFSEEDILYEYRWLAGVIFNNLEISIQQVDDILDDFRRRLLRNDFSSREYFNIKVNQSLFKGEKILAREYLELRDKEPADAMSSWGNDMLTTIYVEMLEGDFDSAISHAADFVAQHSLHHMSLLHVYSGLIYYLGGKMHDKRAEKYFEEIDPEFSKREKYPFQLYEMSLIMYYMAKHRKDRAWEYFEQLVNWELTAESAIQFDFALSILPLLKNGGTRTIDQISIRQPYYREDKTYELNDLYNHYLTMATELAHKFDIRNKNKHFSGQLYEELNYLN